MRIVLELSDKDLRYFRKMLKEVKGGRLAKNEKVVIEATRQLLTEVAEAEAPEFVREQMKGLEDLVDMLEDERWRLEPPARHRLCTALAYFVDPDDLIPDRIPGIGFLDDALMVWLVLEEFRPELDAYQKFRDFEGSEAAVEKKRDTLMERIKKRRQTEADRRKLVKRGKRGPLGLW